MQPSMHSCLLVCSHRPVERNSSCVPLLNRTAIACARRWTRCTHATPTGECPSWHAGRAARVRFAFIEVLMLGQAPVFEPRTALLHSELLQATCSSMKHHKHQSGHMCISAGAGISNVSMPSCHCGVTKLKLPGAIALQSSSSQAAHCRQEGGPPDPPGRGGSAQEERRPPRVAGALPLDWHLKCSGPGRLPGSLEHCRLPFVLPAMLCSR